MRASLVLQQGSGVIPQRRSPAQSLLHRRDRPLRRAALPTKHVDLGDEVHVEEVLYHYEDAFAAGVWPPGGEVASRVLHPGSVASTSCSAARIVGSDAVTLTATATVRYTAGAMDRAHDAHGATQRERELLALGWLALQADAALHIAELAGGGGAAEPSGGAAQQGRHEHVVRMLAHGCVVAAEKRPNSFGHDNHVVTLLDRETQQTCSALFKPSLEGDGAGWHRVPIEAAAYHLNLLLGMDLIPPAVYRTTQCEVAFTHFNTGVFVAWVDGAVELRTVPCPEWGMREDVLLSDTRVLDVLIQNSDRHTGHFLWGPHWARGAWGHGSARGSGKQAQHAHQAQEAQQAQHWQQTAVKSRTWEGECLPLLIDQAAGFRADAFVSLEHDNAFATGATRVISARTYLRLRFLTRNAVAAALGAYITPAEVDALMARRACMLEYFDGLVAQHGYDAVVIDG